MTDHISAIQLTADLAPERRRFTFIYTTAQGSGHCLRGRLALVCKRAHSNPRESAISAEPAAARALLAGEGGPADGKLGVEARETGKFCDEFGGRFGVKFLQ